MRFSLASLLFLAIITAAIAVYTPRHSHRRGHHKPPRVTRKELKETQVNMLFVNLLGEHLIRTDGKLQEVVVAKLVKKLLPKKTQKKVLRQICALAIELKRIVDEKKENRHSRSRKRHSKRQKRKKKSKKSWTSKSSHSDSC